MTNIRNLILVALCLVPVAAMATVQSRAQAAESMMELAQNVGGTTVGTSVGPTGSTMPLSAPNGTNAVPGGITLVPGTVVTPGVSGSSVTGTVPLAGTVGSSGVGNFNPGLAPSAAGNSNALYPALQSQSALPSANQSALPLAAVCPAGVTHAEGPC